MDMLALDAKRFFRLVLGPIALYLSIIVISPMTMIKAAQAEGNVPPLFSYCATAWFVGGAHTYVCDTSYSRACNAISFPITGVSSTYSLTCGGYCVINSNCSWPPYFAGQNFNATSSCPASSTGTPQPNPTSCICNTGYVPDAAKTSCIPVASCPAHASRATPDASCACDTGYVFGADGTSCVLDIPCEVTPLTPLPANDACAQVLESFRPTQAQKDAACGKLSDKLIAGKACLAGKLANMSPAIPMVITSDIRDIAYQAHLREIWDKMELLVALEDDPAKQLACVTRRNDIAAEKGCNNSGPCVSCYAESATRRSHCIKGEPAFPNPSDAKHTQGNAFDVSRIYTINLLGAALGALRPPQTIPQFLDAPTDCKLIWGGTFPTNYDPVHFYAP